MPINVTEDQKKKYLLVQLKEYIRNIQSIKADWFWQFFFYINFKGYTNQRTIGPENAHLKPDLGVLSHNEMTLTLNIHTPLLTS